MRWFRKKWYSAPRRTPSKVLKDLFYNWLYKKEVDERIRHETSRYSQWEEEPRQ
jgi:predicted DNA-binding ArsR family transcriptional regulator